MNEAMIAQAYRFLQLEWSVAGEALSAETIGNLLLTSHEGHGSAHVDV